MKVELAGSKEDLIHRSEGCDYCIFEEIFTEEQRKIKVLDVPLPQSHAHRVSIEYACGKNYAGVCPMKYAAMRAFPDDFVACQLGAIKDFIWDLGKKYNRRSSYTEAIPEWTKQQDLGRGIQESYAERFREVWTLGLRKINEDKHSGMRQNLTSPQIYEIVVSSPEVYDKAVALLKKLAEESRQRDSVGKNK